MRIFGPKRVEVTGEWRKLHNEELRDLYSSSSKINIMKTRRMRWVGHVARLGRRGMHIGYLWESHKEERRLGRSRRRILDNIKMYLRQNGVVWTGLIWLMSGTSEGRLL
jgi:hypothetical protein